MHGYKSTLYHKPSQLKKPNHHPNPHHHHHKYISTQHCIIVWTPVTHLYTYTTLYDPNLVSILICDLHVERSRDRHTMSYDTICMDRISRQRQFIFAHYQMIDYQKKRERYTLKSNDLHSMDKNTRCSVKLKSNGLKLAPLALFTGWYVLMPIHCLVPLPKGTHPKPSIWSASPSASNLSGLNVSGSCQTRGLCWLS